MGVSGKNRAAFGLVGHDLGPSVAPGKCLSISKCADGPLQQRINLADAAKQASYDSIMDLSLEERNSVQAPAVAGLPFFGCGCLCGC